MAEYITKEKAVEIIEQRQKELCPVGRYGRNYVYGSYREKYDAWEEIIDEIENMDAADVAEVRHGRWIISEMNFGYCDIIQKEYTAKKYTCSECGYETGDQAKKFVCCPICMARMD